MSEGVRHSAQRRLGSGPSERLGNAPAAAHDANTLDCHYPLGGPTAGRVSHSERAQSMHTPRFTPLLVALIVAVPTTTAIAQATPPKPKDEMMDHHGKGSGWKELDSFH